MIPGFHGRPTRATVIALLLCIATACSACSSTASLNGTTSATGTVAPATQAPQATPPTALDAYCALVTPAEVQASIGKPITLAFRPFGSTKGDVATEACGFGTSLTAAPVIEIEFSQTIRGSTADQFNAFKASFVSTTPVPNLGDAAYIGVAPDDKDPTNNIQFAVVVRKGSFFFFVGQFNDTNQAAVVAGDEKVAQLYLARL